MPFTESCKNSKLDHVYIKARRNARRDKHKFGPVVTLCHLRGTLRGISWLQLFWVLSLGGDLDGSLYTFVYL